MYLFQCKIGFYISYSGAIVQRRKCQLTHPQQLFAMKIGYLVIKFLMCTYNPSVAKIDTVLQLIWGDHGQLLSYGLSKPLLLICHIEIIDLFICPVFLYQKTLKVLK